MLKTILSISGKPGLFKLVSSNQNMLVVESLSDNSRVPVLARDKVISLGDISIYTENDEVLLAEVLKTMKEKENGAKSSLGLNAKPNEMMAYFETVLPEFDKDRVYPNDIKKVIKWYNLLIEANIDFEKEAVEESSTEA